MVTHRRSNYDSEDDPHPRPHAVEDPAHTSPPAHPGWQRLHAHLGEEPRIRPVPSDIARFESDDVRNRGVERHAEQNDHRRRIAYRLDGVPLIAMAEDGRVEADAVAARAEA